MLFFVIKNSFVLRENIFHVMQILHFTIYFEYLYYTNQHEHLWVGGCWDRRRPLISGWSPAMMGSCQGSRWWSCPHTASGESWCPSPSSAVQVTASKTNITRKDLELAGKANITRKDLELLSKTHTVCKDLNLQVKLTWHVR